MESQKAKKFIDENKMDAAHMVDKDGCGWVAVGVYDAYRAVVLAEREAEDRVIEEAIKAHRACCPLSEFQCLHRDRDDYTCTYNCKYVTSFIQKLNKE